MKLLSLSALATLAIATPASAADPQMWQTPSGNIACAAFGSQLRCDMRELGTPAPPRPANCEGDFGNAFAVTRNGSRGKRICVSDAVGGPGTPTVRYGRTWKRNGFRCRVRRSGVRCTNRRGHGFFLRIGKQTLF
ncbi:MAG TPA: DUF6636 domain-containing protein [Solirubrobacteraceae bacterium]|nr:DUF6636 domain-containing protein [Solirubrobacteraceae bacterium]